MAKTIKNMHYDFKQKLNRLDTNTYAGLKIPEIDRKLNQALRLYILLVAEPRIKNQLGIEGIQRTIDDISTIVADNVPCELKPVDNYTWAYLPSEPPYLYYLSTENLIGTSGDCENQKIKTTVIRHDSRSQDRSFYDSNFDWRECNIRFAENRIKIYNTDFQVVSFSINYIRNHPYIHNAEDFADGVYKLPNGDILEGFKDCELPEQTFDEITDLAVMLTSGDLQLPITNQLINNVLRTKQLIIQ